MSACLLLDPFQQYLEMSVICGLSICTASEKNCSVGNGNVLLEFFSGGGLGGNSDNKVGLQVIAEKMFFFPCRKMSLSAGCFQNSRPISNAGTVEFI